MKTTWALRILAFAGLAISVYLLTLKLTGKITYLVGCGEGSGCANVLGSRWSQFFYIPVSAFAAVMYAALLVATWKDGAPRLNACLDDCAFTLQVLIEALQWQWDSELLQWAWQLAEVLIDDFFDPQRDGLFFTSHDHEQLISRSRTFHDEAIPAGNAVAAQALYYLGLL